MKKYAILMLVALTAFASCENIEDNSPALQGEIDSTFFKASTALFITDGNGRYVIQGATARRTVSLGLSDNAEGTYNLGANGNNYASYEDENGNIYSTTPLGNGQVIITDVENDGSLTGTFSFMAVRPGIDTIYMSKGRFYQVPASVFNEDDDGGGSSTNDGTLSATIDGAPFTPITVNATDTGNSLIIIGTSSSLSILLQLPADIEAGTYNLPSAGIDATYTENGVSTDASSGSVTITAHDTAAGTISGTFSFQAGATGITSGAFDVTY